MSIYAESVARTLLHFLWQGALIGLAAALTLRLLRKDAPRARYLTGCAFLLAMALAPVITFRLIETAGTPQLLATLPALNAAPVTKTVGAASAEPAWLNNLFLAWLAGVAVLSIRTIGGWTLAMRCLSATRIPSAIDPASIAKRLGITRAVRIYESAHLAVPTTWGTVKPVILLPVSTVLNLDHAQLEAILAHELAHIARHDFLVNCIQTAIETLLFYHPAVWWLSRTIRHEREVCCDHLAASLVGDRILYSRALLALEETRDLAITAPHPALAATGSDLKARIHRLLGPGTPDRTPFLPALLILVTLLTGAAAVTLRAQQQAPQTPWEKWLAEDVVYIIQPEERNAFQSLKSDPERDQFIKQFWEIRGGETAKKEHYRRIMYANERFASGIPGWKTDRGRIYIQIGPPDEIESHPGGPREHWLYKNGRRYDFYGPDYKLTNQQGVALQPRQFVMKTIDTDNLDEPTRRQLEPVLAAFIGKPMSNDLMNQIRAAARRIDNTLSFSWNLNKEDGTASLDLASDSPSPPPPPPASKSSKRQPKPPPPPPPPPAGDPEKGPPPPPPLPPSQP